MATSPSISKNSVKRMLLSLVDFEPTWNEINEMLGYFGYECFYCGKEFVSLREDFTLDHVVPRAQNGTNCIANRVPACTRCNCHERRDKPFEEFLRTKCKTDAEFEEKRSVVAFWCATSFHQHRQVPPELWELVNDHIRKIHEVIDSSVASIREMKKELGFPKLKAKDFQKLSGIEPPPKGVRARGNARR
jgi:hypothetical protein